MARTILTISLILFLNILIGCNDPNSGKSQLRPDKEMDFKSLALIQVPSAAEADLIEELMTYRQAYRGGLEKLIEYYGETGNNMKLAWAQKELKATDTMASYNYIIQATLAGPDLKAIQNIPQADELYYEAVALDKKAEVLLLFKDESKLRLALDKYNQLIREYPGSDKIDDAAYRAARIYEHFRDYTIAVLYYKRTFQWNPDTLTTAKYKAAFLLDYKLHDRDQALDLYKQALEEGNLYESTEEMVTLRIAELTRGDRPELK
ncbi:MAG: tetratricopeptide repeat protein [Planctomycetota bacterium]|jgi:tetratricopeptide (TPR) repeat protein